MVNPKLITIEVAYATLKKQHIITLEVEENCPIKVAIELSGILTVFPEIELSNVKVGVFSHARKLTDLVKAGDRIEIYRPLLLDPKDSRRAKAKVKLKKN